MRYELTVTLRPLLYRHSPAEQLRMTWPVLNDLLDETRATVVAELTQEENIHYHCLLELADARQKTRLLNRFRRYHNLFGRKTISQVLDELAYTKYMQKDLAVTRPVIGRDACLMDDLEVMADLGISGALFGPL